MATHRSGSSRAGLVALVVSSLMLVAVAPVDAGPSAPSNAPRTASAGASAGASAPAMRRVVLLGLKGHGAPIRFAGSVSSPASGSYRKFLTPAQYRSRFSPAAGARNRVRRYLTSQSGVTKVQFSSSRTVALAIVTPSAAKRIFCAKGSRLPATGLCKPKQLRTVLQQISIGEPYPIGKGASSAGPPQEASANKGTPEGCEDAVKTKAFTPNQMATAYGVDGLYSRGLDGSGIRVATLSSQQVETSSFKTWGQCFGLPTPEVKQIAMPGAVKDTSTDPEETVLDIEALATLAPKLEQITPIFVPLDQGFSNSFLLFMFGALDPSRQGGKLPHILSISDGVCEDRFTGPELQLGQRLLAEASSMGITTLAASGDLGFRGCFTSAKGAMFPSSSRFTTSIGGTDFFLTAGNAIAREEVWSTYATEPAQGVGSGGGPSKRWPRPGFQTAQGIGPSIQSGKPTRLSPDIAAMASFVPGISVYQNENGGWGVGGGTSTSTPLTAAMVALILQQEYKAGRPALGSLPPLLYSLASGPAYGSLFYDITIGTSSQQPKSAIGKTPAGGAAQPGYDVATGLGSLKATAFADAVAALPATP